MEMNNKNLKDIMAFHRKVMHEEIAALDTTGELTHKQRYDIAKIVYKEFKDTVPISELNEYKHGDS